MILKKILIVLFIVFIPFISYQQNLNDINWKKDLFVINKTNISIIDVIKKDLKVKIKYIGINEHLNFKKLNSKNDIEIFEILIDSNYSEYKIYYISEYEMNSDIILKNIYLIFHNNYLTEFICDYNEDDNIFNFKGFNKPSIEENNKIKNINSNTLIYNDNLKKTIYKKNNIKCAIINKNYIFNTVTVKIYSYIIIFDIRNKSNVENLIFN